MKTRNGFVSNSSSSSFCIYGSKNNSEFDGFDFNNKIQVLRKIKNLYSKEFSNYIDNNQRFNDRSIAAITLLKNIEDDNFVANVSNNKKTLESISTEEICDIAGLEIHYSEEGGTYIGKSWKNIGDDETGKIFKTNIEDKIKIICNKKVKCNTVEEAWYNG